MRGNHRGNETSGRGFSRVVKVVPMKLVIAASGASGAIYLQRLLHHLPTGGHDIHLILSGYAQQVIREEIDVLKVPPGVTQHGDQSMDVPFVSGSARFDAMVIVPCSMGTLGRIAAGTSETTILRAADVFLKEKRRLILVPRETPWSLIHARNVATLLEAGATVMPASPSFYSRPRTIEEAADTVVFRILDHLDIPHPAAYRWKNEGKKMTNDE